MERRGREREGRVKELNGREGEGRRKGEGRRGGGGASIELRAHAVIVGFPLFHLITLEHIFISS